MIDMKDVGKVIVGLIASGFLLAVTVSIMNLFAQQTGQEQISNLTIKTVLIDMPVAFTVFVVILFVVFAVIRWLVQKQ